MSATVSRRTVAATAAWTVPAVTLAAAAPALAASGCVPTLTSMGGATFYQGAPGTAVNASLSFGRVTVSGLPAGVTVTSISVTYDIQQKTTRTDGSAGYPSPSNTYVSKQTSAGGYSSTAWAPGGTYAFYDSKNGGWSGNKVTYLGQNRTINWGDGVARTSWAVKNTWTANSAGDPRVLQTSASGGCTTATLMEMGQLNLSSVYTVAGLDLSTYLNIDVTLSDGTVLHREGMSTYKW